MYDTSNFQEHITRLKFKWSRYGHRTMQDTEISSLVVFLS